MEYPTVPSGQVIAAQWRAERDTLAGEIQKMKAEARRDFRFTPRKLSKFARAIFRNELRRVPMNPARRDKVLRAFVNCLRFSRKPIPLVAAELRAVWKATAPTA